MRRRGGWRRSSCPAERRGAGAGRAGFGVIPVSVWRWAKALAGGGVAGLVPAQGAAARLEADPAEGGADPGAGPAGRARPRSPSRQGCRNPRSATCCAPPARPRSRPRRRTQAPAAGEPAAGHAAAEPSAGAEAASLRSRRCCRYCRTRCPGTPSGRWPGSGCWARAPRRRSRRARGTRWPGCCSRCRRWRSPGCWPARGRSTGGCGTGSTAWR